MRHLAKYVHDVTLDVTETWCSEWDHGKETRHIDRCDCAPCLQAAIDYGKECAERLKKLRGAR